MSLIMFIMITSLIALALIILFKSKHTKHKGLLLPPGSYGWPILGETIQFFRASYQGSIEKFIRDKMKKYKTDQVFKTSLLGESFAVVCGPAGNKLLFSNEMKLVTIWWPGTMRTLIGKSIATAAGVEGVQMRKMVSYFLTPDAFSKLYIKNIDIVSRQHIDAYWQGKEELKVYPTIKMFAFEVACRSFMSIEDPSQVKNLSKLFNVFQKGVFSIPLNFPGAEFYKGKKATVAIKKELGRIVRQRRVALEQKTASPTQDLLSHLLVTPSENGEFMSESVIVNNILLLLFAGHDTSTSTITMLIKVLAEHPHVYDAVLREQNEIASSKEPGEFLEWGDIKKMKYSWNVLSETMRLLPPVIGGHREALVDINYAGYIIPKGWKLIWNAHVTHMDSSLFPDVTKFDPSRYDGAGPPPYSYVPFGGGPRMCPGKEFARLEILTFLHNVIRRFRWDLVIPDEKMIYHPMITPEKGLPIRIHPHKA
ncbi:hypothetical protein CASFOL_037999 [Castilleja foliolosa]|uniref:Cytochrome P450 n=1 Tax=Castilleja foliolosa TaxID=1961234 RepID=A0ABD3BJR1_9LAMI